MVDLFSQLRQRPHFEAVAIFDQIRRGDSVEAMLTAVRDGDMLVDMSSRSSPQAMNRVPPERQSVTLPPLRMAVPYVDTNYPVDKLRSLPCEPLPPMEMCSR
jgi:hypothetical protein